MGTSALEFEKPLAEVEKQIDELKRLAEERQISVDEELAPLEKKLGDMRKEIYENLTPIQRVQVARSPRRPFTLDYIRLAFTDWIEVHGDRAFRDDPAIVGGWARIDGETIMVIGHQRGRDTKENLHRNFGMPNPEGYRKALRLMTLAEKFHVPVVTLIDTPGAWAGLGAEERGQSEAIAHIATIPRSSAAGRASTARRSRSSASSAAATPGKISTATSGCRIPRATARRFGS